MVNVLFVTGREESVGRKSPRHGSDGRVEIAIVGIPDPLTGKQRPVAVNMRESGVGRLHLVGRVTDRQKEAADKFRDLYERTVIGGLKGTDYSRVIVDCGSQGSDPLSVQLMLAAKELARIHGLVRDVGFKLLVSLCVEGRLVSDVVGEFVSAGMSQRTATAYVTQRLIEALDELDKIWFVAKGVGGGGVRADRHDKPFDVHEFEADRKRARLKAI